MLMPGEVARLSEGNLIKETRLKTCASAQTNHKLQLKPTPKVQRRFYK
jgi:hypothetical protein